MMFLVHFHAVLKLTWQEYILLITPVQFYSILFALINFGCTPRLKCAPPLTALLQWRIGSSSVGVQLLWIEHSTLFYNFRRKSAHQQNHRYYRRSVRHGMNWVRFRTGIHPARVLIQEARNTPHTHGRRKRGVCRGSDTPDYLCGDIDIYISPYKNLIPDMQTVRNTYWDAGKGNLTAQNTRKPFGGPDSAPDPVERAYTALPQTP